MLLTVTSAYSLGFFVLRFPLRIVYCDAFNILLLIFSSFRVYFYINL